MSRSRTTRKSLMFKGRLRTYWPRSTEGRRSSLKSTKLSMKSSTKSRRVTESTAKQLREMLPSRRHSRMMRMNRTPRMRRKTRRPQRLKQRPRLVPLPTLIPRLTSISRTKNGVKRSGRRLKQSVRLPRRRLAGLSMTRNGPNWSIRISKNA